MQASHGRCWSTCWRSTRTGWWFLALILLAIILTVSCRSTGLRRAPVYETPAAGAKYTLVVQPEAHGPGTVHLDSPSFR